MHPTVQCTIHDYFLYYLQYNLYKPLQITYTDEHFSHSEKIKIKRTFIFKRVWCVVGFSMANPDYDGGA